MNDTQMTYGQAAANVVKAQQRKIANVLRAERVKLDRAKASQRRAQERFDKTVALAVSGKPARDDWYAHHGPLPRDQVISATGLTTVSLHRLMERYRKRSAKRRTRKTRD